MLPKDYTYKNCLCWGIFKKHCEETNKARIQKAWGRFFTHTILAALEFAPIISQIISIAEKYLVKFIYNCPKNKDSLIQSKNVINLTTKDPLSKQEVEPLSKIETLKSTLNLPESEKIINIPCKDSHTKQVEPLTKIAIVKTEITSSSETLDLPESERWRLFIDFKRAREENGNKYMFDDEKGYCAAMEEAFKFVFDGKHPPRMNAVEFEKLHDMCINNVLRKNGQPFPRNFYFLPHHYEFPYICNSDVKKEWKEERLILDIDDEGNMNLYLTFRALNEKKWHIYSLFTNEKIPKVDEFFAEYYEKISKADDTISKIKEMARLCRRLEIFHCFGDGNQRTIAFALLNYLLKEEGFPPVILNNPDCFDGYMTLNQLVEEILNGIANYYNECIRLDPVHKLPKTLEHGGKFAWLLTDPACKNELWDKIREIKKEQNKVT